METSMSEPEETRGAAAEAADENPDYEAASDGEWYAVRTRSNFEFRARKLLDQKAITTFLPTLIVPSRRKDRRTWLHRPLFGGYLFVQVALAPANQIEILKTPGVVHLLTVDGRPRPVDPAEIDNLKRLDGADQRVLPHRYMKRGDRVIIQEGPFAGVTGIYQRRKNQTDRVVVVCQALQRAVAVEIEEWALEKL
jgi:transcription antitermination factor NusG